jgi:two-component system OmpR family response regulator
MPHHKRSGYVRGAFRSATRTRGTRSHRVLVVEDDPVLCLVNSEALIRAGYEVDTAEDGQAAWEALQGKRYDLLVTDNNMPRVTGVELLKRLRSEGEDLPAILVSGAMPTEELRRNPWLELSAALSKPFTSSELIDVVRTVLLTTANARPRSKSAAESHHHLAVQSLVG